MTCAQQAVQQKYPDIIDSAIALKSQASTEYVDLGLIEQVKIGKRLQYVYTCIKLTCLVHNKSIYQAKYLSERTKIILQKHVRKYFTNIETCR